MEFTIRNMMEQDKQEVLDMMRVFYASPAVQSNGSDEIFENDIRTCIEGSPYLEGYVFEDGEDVREEGERLAASYVNFYFSNGAVIMPAFGGKNAESDQRAAEILHSICPQREILPVYARDILTGGGNIHCITQQIPQGKAEKE